MSFLANGQSPKDRDVVEDDGDHLEDFTGLNGRGSVLDEEKFLDAVASLEFKLSVSQ